MYWKLDEGSGTIANNTGSGPSPISYVQSNIVVGEPVTCTTGQAVSFDTTPTPGNLIVVAVSVYRDPSTTLNAPTDNQSGNTYTVTSSTLTGNSSGSQRVSVYYAKNVAASGTYTVTATSPDSGNCEFTIAVHEYAGADKNSPLDQTTSNIEIGETSAVESGSVTTTQNDELYFGAMSYDGVTTTIATDPDYTNREENDANSNDVSLATQDKIANSGSHDSTWTLGADRDWGAVIATFKPAVQLSRPDGSFTGATWKTEDQCVSGKCVYIDGTDDNISAGDPPNNILDFGASESFSVEAWVKHSGA